MGVIHILTKNDVFEAVSAASLTCAATAAQLKLHEPFLCRLMDAGVTLGLLSKSDGKFATTDMSALLLRDAEGSLKSLVLMINNEYQHPAWDAIGTGGSLRTGKSGFEVAHGMPVWDYYAGHPEAEAEFDDAMTSFTGPATGSILASYAFPPNGTICDVGGSVGGTLKLLLDHYPTASGIVFDRPTVIERTTRRSQPRGWLRGRRASPAISSLTAACRRAWRLATSSFSSTSFTTGMMLRRAPSSRKSRP